MFVCERAGRAYDLGRHRLHACRTLHDGLEDDRRGARAMRGHHRLERFRCGRNALHFEEERIELLEERHRIAHGHRSEGVAVVPALQRNEQRALAFAAPRGCAVARLECDLDRGAAVVAEEGARQAIRRGRGQALGEHDGGLVRAAREEYVVELRGLGGERVDEARMPVAVQACPPRRDRVEYASAVGELEPRARGSGHG